MPTIPVGFGQAVFRYSLSGDPEEMLTTIGFSVGAGEDDDVGNLALALVEIEAEWFENIVQGPTFLYTGWTYLGARATVNTTVTGEVVLEAPRVVVGTASGETPPVNTAILVKKTGLLGGRAHRGRMYIPPAGLSEANVSKLGVLDGGTLTGWQGFMTAFLTEVETDNVADLYLLHNDLNTGTQQNPVWVPNPMAPDRITALTVDQRVATQRRRLRH